MVNLKTNLKTKSYPIIHQNAQNCIILMIFLGGACPEPPSKPHGNSERW